MAAPEGAAMHWVQGQADGGSINAPDTGGHPAPAILAKGGAVFQKLSIGF
jgi:hypothetical protein